MKVTFDPYLNDKLTERVKRAVKSGRTMSIDADGRSVDVKTGELIGPDPAIEQPLTKAGAFTLLGLCLPWFEFFRILPNHFHRIPSRLARMVGRLSSLADSGWR